MMIWETCHDGDLRYRDNSPILSVVSLQGRVTVQRSGNLILNPVKADDAGTYVCEVNTNMICIMSAIILLFSGD